MRHGLMTMLGLMLVGASLAGCKDKGADATPAAASAAAAPARPSGVIVGYAAPALVGGQLAIYMGFEQRAKGKGWQLITLNSTGPASVQNQQIKRLIDLHVNAIVTVPEDSKSSCEGIEAARAAKIPIYTIDRAPEGCRLNMAVLSDNAMAGRQCGESLIELLKQKNGGPKGTVLELTGNISQNVAQLRSKGFHEVVDKYADVKVITKVGSWDKDLGAKLVNETLDAVPGIDGVFMHSDSVYVPTVVPLLRTRGQLHKRGEKGHIFLLTIDGGPDGMQALKDGYVDHIAAQPMTDFGIVVDWIDKELRGEPIVEGEVKQDNVLWSPARVSMTDVGPRLVLPTASLTESNMNDPRVWGNQR